MAWVTMIGGVRTGWQHVGALGGVSSDIARWIVCLLLLLGSLQPTPGVAASIPPPGASSCTGCHPPGGDGAPTIPPLDGRPAAATIAALLAFKSGAVPATVMDRIVKGFSDAEVEAIAQWFAERK